MSKETYMIESLVSDLVTRIVEERGLSMTEALDVVCMSKTFRSLSDVSTGLYFQSPAYVYDELMTEVQ